MTKDYSKLEKLINKLERIEYFDTCLCEIDTKNEIIDQIAKEIDAFKVTKRIGYTLFHSHKKSLVRIASFMEFDGRKYRLWFEHSLTEGKWYWEDGK